VSLFLASHKGWELTTNERKQDNEENTNSIIIGFVINHWFFANNR
jgi:hypothetical protein